MAEYLTSPAFQAHLVLALSGLTSAYVAVARPTLTSSSSAAAAASPPTTHGSQPAGAAAAGERPTGHSGRRAASPAATLYEAGSSPVLSSGRLAALRGGLAVYIFVMGAAQIARLGAYVLKFYTIWNWWLLGIYFALSALASLRCARAEAAAAAAAAEGPAAEGAKRPVAAAAAAVSANGRAAAAPPLPPLPSSEPVPRGLHLHAATPLSRACHALFHVNSSTVIIVDAVCWGVLYPMLTRGPQTPEIQAVVKRLLLTFTSYNQHGLNAVIIYTDLLLNRQRLAFHAAGHLGLWSMAFALWAHGWHAASGKWLYPFLDTSKPWAPAAYLGLYLVHWAAFGLVALMHRLKGALYARLEGRRKAQAGEAGKAGKAGKAE